MKRRFAAAAAALLLGLGAASDPAERLADPVAEARARALFEDLRCVVCQNESLAGSEAPLAGDLRKIVREQVAAGRSDAQVRTFLVDRYGDFVLLKPRFSVQNLVLWLTPLVIVLAGLGFAFRRRGRAEATAAPLSDDEERRLRDFVTASEVDGLASASGAPLIGHGTPRQNT